MLGENIRRLRNEKNLTLDQLASELNNKYPDTLFFNKGKLSKWENDKEEPKLSSARILADYFGVSIDNLYSESELDITYIYNELSPQNKHTVYNFAKKTLNTQMKKQIISGRQSAAGAPLDGECEDANINLVEIRNEIPRGADEVITIKGDSMEPELINGSAQFIHYQPVPDYDGQIVIVSIENLGVTCKKFYQENNKVRLVSINPKYDDMIFPCEEVRVIGKIIK